MNLLTLIGHIFMNSMIPIFMLIGVGFVLDKKFKLDLYTLSKLNFYILLPTLYLGRCMRLNSLQVHWKLFSVHCVYLY